MTSTRSVARESPVPTVYVGAVAPGDVDARLAGWVAAPPLVGEFRREPGPRARVDRELGAGLRDAGDRRRDRDDRRARRAGDGRGRRGARRHRPEAVPAHDGDAKRRGEVAGDDDVGRGGRSRDRGATGARARAALPLVRERELVAGPAALRRREPLPRLDRARDDRRRLEDRQEPRPHARGADPVDAIDVRVEDPAAGSADEADRSDHAGDAHERQDRLDRRDAAHADLHRDGDGLVADLRRPGTRDAHRRDRRSDLLGDGLRRRALRNALVRRSARRVAKPLCAVVADTSTSRPLKTKTRRERPTRRRGLSWKLRS